MVAVVCPFPTATDKAKFGQNISNHLQGQQLVTFTNEKNIAMTKKFDKQDEEKFEKHKILYDNNDSPKNDGLFCHSNASTSL